MSKIKRVVVAFSVLISATLTMPSRAQTLSDIAQAQRQKQEREFKAATAPVIDPEKVKAQPMSLKPPAPAYVLYATIGSGSRAFAEVAIENKLITPLRVGSKVGRAKIVAIHQGSIEIESQDASCGKSKKSPCSSLATVKVGQTL